MFRKWKDLEESFDKRSSFKFYLECIYFWNLDNVLRKLKGPWNYEIVKLRLKYQRKIIFFSET
ncbi:unnamed protein product [Lasius platythorax]|uniref:Uncharacterized protein n=1 Tax=Lasius platythorax TaxID=488582 RepID=A0AAV2P7G9_9HYME